MTNREIEIIKECLLLILRAIRPIYSHERVEARNEIIKKMNTLKEPEQLEIEF